MSKKEFRKQLESYVNTVLDYFEHDLSHANTRIEIAIERHQEIIQLSNQVYDNGLPFSIQPPMLLHNPQHKDVKPKSFQEVLDKINEFATV